MMRPTVDNNRGDADRPPLRSLRLIVAALTAAVIIVGGYLIFREGSSGSGPSRAAGEAAGEAFEETGPVVDQDTTTSSSTTIATITTTTTTPSTIEDPPPPGPRIVIPPTEVEPEAKQLAADIAYALTTYEDGDNHHERLEALAGVDGVDSLAASSAPLTHPGYWSRGEVIYPQLGGLRNDRVSVMVVTRQTVGSGSRADYSVVRTLDIRLARGMEGWVFDFLGSAGGSFQRLEDLDTAHAVAADPRVVMPDSARLDILSGLISPTLLGVMADLADETSYEVVVLATGHPENVFETERVSHHTVGRAVDIIRIGDRLVIDDREPGSSARATVEWLYGHPDVDQVGSPWDIDGEESRRSFTNLVHQDHIHLAVEDR